MINENRLRKDKGGHLGACSCHQGPLQSEIYIFHPLRNQV